MKREKVFDGLSRAIQCSHTVILEMKNMCMPIEDRVVGLAIILEEKDMHIFR